MSAWGDFEKSSCIIFLHVKVYIENIISPFWIFHWGHGVPISLLLTVKGPYPNKAKGTLVHEREHLMF